MLPWKTRKTMGKTMEKTISIRMIFRSSSTSKMWTLRRPPPAGNTPLTASSSALHVTRIARRFLESTNTTGLSTEGSIDAERARTCSRPMQTYSCIGEGPLLEYELGFLYTEFRAMLGPVFFQPSNWCEWSSSLVIRNILSGVEWLPLLENHVAAAVIYRCLAHCHSFDPERTTIFDFVIEGINDVLKASEQLEENLLLGRGVVFCCMLEAVPFLANGDNVKLPPYSFTEISEQGAFDKGPLHLSLSIILQEAGSQISKSTHAGVLQFTADEGTVGVPPHVWNSLFSTETVALSMVEARYTWLCKGTYAKLQPDNLGFSDIPTHKAVLETSLSQHATLSEGDVLKVVSYGSLAYSLRVLELKPSSYVSVLETDIEVDIIGSDMDAESSRNQTLKHLLFGKSEAGVVEEGNYMYYKLVLDESTSNRVSSGEAIVEIRVEQQDQNGGDTDLYISKHPLLFPNRHQHEWSSHDVGTKVLVFDSKAKNFTPSTYCIGIYGFKGNSKYALSAAIRVKAKSKVGQQISSLPSATFACGSKQSDTLLSYRSAFSASTPAIVPLARAPGSKLQANGDKVKLPPYSFTELSEQGAFDKGLLSLSGISALGTKETSCLCHVISGIWLKQEILLLMHEIGYVDLLSTKVNVGLGLLPLVTPVADLSC